MRHITHTAHGYLVRFIQSNPHTRNEDLIAHKTFLAMDYIDGWDEALHWAQQWRDDFERDHPEFVENTIQASPWWVYIVRCADGTLYTGISTDMEKRIAAHNAGKGARYTRSRRPVKLVYLEPAESRSVASRREYEIKQMPVAQKSRLMGGRKIKINA